ncbi:MAG: HEAT repeat domain-containing protein [Planctomycetales bacterium]
MAYSRWTCFAVVCAIVAAACLASAAEPLDGNPRTVYFTVGDAQDLLEFPPLDSRTSIAAAFETLREQWRMGRIWWRGGQDEIWGEQFVIRPENRQFARVWDWWRDLQYRKVGTNRIAVEEAHRLGMKIDLTYGLFDNGSHPDAGYSGFPYAAEDKLRVAHPEWAPVNRWGTWRQGGPIEFAYPEARQGMADYLAQAVLDGKYDGISFLTYAENFSQRYEDEFGYNEPIVEEFRRQYGKDIRREEFDREAWRRLRGSHVTEFLRLLKKQLSPHGKRIAVCVHGKEPEKAMFWNVDGGVPTAGNFRWSMEEWLRGDVVDEICLASPAADEVVARLQAQIRDRQSPVLLTVFRSRGDLPAGTPRVMFLGREIESGYESDHWIDYPDEKLTAEPAASLSGQNVFARRRVMTLAMKGKLSLSAAEYTRALGDADLYVRRTALRGISAQKVAGLGPALIKLLSDPENTVRCLAAHALADTAAAEGRSPLLAAAFDPRSTFQFHYRAVPDALKKLAGQPELLQQVKHKLVEQLNQESPHARELALHYFALLGAPATPVVEERLTRIVLEDANEYCRELAIVNLRSSFGATVAVTEVMRRVMRTDRSAAVQVRGAAAYASMAARLPVEDKHRQEGLDAVMNFFRQYGDGSERADNEWGWRLLGNAILEFGPAGEGALKHLMGQPDNRLLSDRAWRILHLKQGDQFFPITEEADAAAHRLHPWLR